jgi:hypothetical protein
LLGGAALLAFGATRWNWRDHEAMPEITATVVRAELPITVTERGELESSKTVDVRCEVDDAAELDAGTLVPRPILVVDHDPVARRPNRADSRGFWDQRGVKEYETIVRLSDVPPDAGLKPGMTAEVKILVDRLSDVLVVPVQAVAEHAGEHVSYVVADGTVEQRAVSVGENNDQFIEITGGLCDGERVALDARARVEAAAETSNEQPKNGPEPSTEGSEPVDAGQAL